MIIRDGMCYPDDPQPMLQIVAADRLGDYRLMVTFNDGEKRIFDGHVRNIDPGDNGSAGVSAPNGVIQYRRIFEALRDIGYEGCLGLELANAFGKDGDPLWIPESIGYFRGMIDSIR